MTKDDDIDLMLADGDDLVIAGGYEFASTLWTHDEAFGKDAHSEGQSIGRSYLLLRASLFPALAVGDAITVNGATYKASLISRVQDGKVLHVFLGVL